jgi:hypothetical protein
MWYLPSWEHIIFWYFNNIQIHLLFSTPLLNSKEPKIKSFHTKQLDKMGGQTQEVSHHPI